MPPGERGCSSPGVQYTDEDGNPVRVNNIAKTRLSDIIHDATNIAMDLELSRAMKPEEREAARHLMLDGEELGGYLNDSDDWKNTMSYTLP